jgi:hypothetical protein
MPLVIHPRVRKSIRRVAAMTCFAVFASSGAAFASCQSQPTSTPFTQWGDNNSYFLIPGGSFEGSPSQVGWTLSNASLTAGNEPFNVNSSSDSQSLTIDAGGSGTSPWFCVDNTMPSFRVFAHQVSRRSRSPTSLTARCPPGDPWRRSRSTPHRSRTGSVCLSRPDSWFPATPGAGRSTTCTSTPTAPAKPARATVAGERR